jgi:ABC-type multidrug transport system permease subunit
MSASSPPGEVPIVATPDAESSHTEVRILWTGFLRNLWKEIFEFRSRPILLGVIFGLSIGTTLAAGNLNIQPPPIRIQLYQPGPESEISPNFNDASTLLQQYSNVRVIRMAGSFLDLTAMQRDGAHYAVVPRGDSWVVFYNFPTLQQEEQTAWFINVLSTSLSEQKPLIAESAQSNLQNTTGPKTANVAEPNVQKIGPTSRISALPGDSKILLVPRAILLTVLFLPFVMCARSFSREVAFETLPTILATPNGGWAPLLAAKAVASSWLSLLILLLLVLAIRPIFGVAPKPGLFLQLGAQGLAISTSAILGLFAAVWLRNQSQIYISVSIYFLVLVLLSGFLFPLETASPLIRAASNFSPLTYSENIFENWLFYGTNASVFGVSIMLMTAQLVAAGLALFSVSWIARRRM